MIRINLPAFYDLGTKLNPLTKMDGYKVSQRLDILMAAWTLKTHILYLFSTFKDLSVCRASGDHLIKAIDKIDDFYFQNKNDPERMNATNFVTNSLFLSVIDAAQKFEVVLSEELQMLATYFVNQKGIYSTADLIDQTENAFPPSVHAKFDEATKFEIRQGGRCLAFDSFTASGFHVLRATELVLHKYYLSVCKPGQESKLKTWGEYIQKLREIKTDEVQKTIALLQQIKDQDRNLIMHPETVLTADESFKLFEICKSIIMNMADELPTPQELIQPE